MLLDLVSQLKALHWTPERGSAGRRCGRCKLVKAQSEFNSKGGGKSHLYNSYCRMCENEYKRDKYNSRRAR